MGDVDALVQLMADAASALIRGDARTYASLVRHSDDFTLMPPTGGEPRRGFDGSDEALDALARYFKSGERSSRSSIRMRRAIWPFSWPSSVSAGSPATCGSRTCRSV